MASVTGSLVTTAITFSITAGDGGPTTRLDRGKGGLLVIPACHGLTPATGSGRPMRYGVSAVENRATALLLSRVFGARLGEIAVSQDRRASKTVRIIRILVVLISPN